MKLDRSSYLKRSKKLKQAALLKHKIILQAAFCVEDLLMETEKNGGRPWIAVVAQHMEALIDGGEKEKYAKAKRKGMKCST